MICSKNWASRAFVFFYLLLVAISGVQAGTLQTQTQTKNLPPTIKRPILFEPNYGQSAAPADYLAHGMNYKLTVDAQGVGLSLHNTNNAAQLTTKLTFPGASPQAKIQPLESLPSHSNYLRGKKSEWLTAVPHFSKIQYSSLYPGIDLLLYGNQGSLEYDFIVAPGANPKTIRLHFSEVEDLHIDAQGDLILTTKYGCLQQPKPLIYQEADGKKIRVAGNYLLLSSQEIGFEIAAYDISKPLIIDPLLVYGSFIGNLGNDLVMAMAIDSSDNLYFTGTTDSVVFPVTEGAFSTSLGDNGTDIFVLKLNAAGTDITWATYIGGDEAEWPADIAVDSAGDVYIVGNTTSNEDSFPVTSGAADENFNEAEGSETLFGDAFVLKLAAAGDDLTFASYLGGESNDVATAVAVHTDDTVYVCGYTQSDEDTFPITSGAYLDEFQGTKHQYANAFITIFASDGSSIDASTYLSGSDNNSFASAIALDSSGNAYVTGITTSTDFPTTSGTVQETSAGSQDVFIVVMDPSLDTNSLTISTLYGGTLAESVNDIVLDVDDNIYITGWTISDDLTTSTTAYSREINEDDLNTDVYVAKLNPTATALTYATYFGGGNSEAPIALTVGSGSDPNVFITGYTDSLDLPMLNPLQSTYQGFQDCFVVELDDDASDLVFSTLWGDEGIDEPAGIALDSNDYIVVSGWTSSQEMPTRNGENETFFPTDLTQGFVIKINTGAQLSLATTASASAVDVNDAFTLTVTITNSGTATAEDIVFTASVPTGIGYTSATPSQGSCSESDGTVTCDLGDIAGAGAPTVTFNLTADSIGEVSLANQLIDIVDSSPTNDTATDDITISTDGDDDLTLSLTSAESEIAANATSTFTLILRNTGDDSFLAGNTVRIDLAPEASFVYATSTVEQDSAGDLTWTLPALAADTDYEIQELVIRFANASTIQQKSKTIMVSMPNAVDSDTSNNTTSVDILVNKSTAVDETQNGGGGGGGCVLGNVKTLDPTFMGFGLILCYYLLLPLYRRRGFRRNI